MLQVMPTISTTRIANSKVPTNVAETMTNRNPEMEGFESFCFPYQCGDIQVPFQLSEKYAPAF